jgi:hypothetical protein
VEIMTTTREVKDVKVDAGNGTVLHATLMRSPTKWSRPSKRVLEVSHASGTVRGWWD